MKENIARKHAFLLPWASPLQTLERNSRKEIVLYPPQGYELCRLLKFNDIEKLANFAKNISCKGNELLYPVHLQARDGIVQLMPGDHLYPPNVDPNKPIKFKEDKTILDLRDTNQTLHRFEINKTKVVLVTQNYKPTNHINMGDQVMPINVTIHKND